ncbi:MAG: M20 family metallopeptidase [Halobacteriaceae archaeon]
MTGKLTALTRSLARVPSHEDESAVAADLADWLRDETDADVTVDEADNVLARRGDGEPTLALVGHHDTVAPADAQVAARDPDGTPTELEVSERDGRLYGRGTADMKGPLAACCLAFRDATPETGSLVLASFAGEETGGAGARHAIDAGFAPDCAVVAEGSTGYSAPGVTDVAVGHKGRRGSTVTARGAAAHASEPENGENAVYRACDAIDVLRDLDAPAADVLGHEVTGSVVVTEIEGGSGWNVVPERCTLTVDERTVPDARADLGRVEGLDGVEWTVDQDLPPMRCDDPDFADDVLAAADAVQDGDPEQVVKPHATDAGWLAAAGTTCVVCGACEPGEAHTDDESVSVAVLARCRELYGRVADRVVG